MRSRYGHRIEILDGESFGGNGYKFDTIKMYLEFLREENPLIPIWVNVDSFDDVDPGLNFDPKIHTSKEQYLSREFKSLAERLNMVILFTKHQNKNNRGRGMSSDIARGSGQLEYDSTIFLMMYSEVAELGQSAEVYFDPGLR